MNYLAHAYLSFNNEPILIGNMISDFVKGKNKYNYNHEIQKGIALHRFIDTFTDQHPSTKEGKQILKPTAGAYAGAFMDIVYDYFLANDTYEFENAEALQACANKTYAFLQQNESILPLNFQNMLPYMQKQNWLYNYQFHWGIENSFKGLTHRAAYFENSTPVFEAFLENENALYHCYKNFFVSVKKEVQNIFPVL